RPRDPPFLTEALIVLCTHLSWGNRTCKNAYWAILRSIHGADSAAYSGSGGLSVVAILQKRATRPGAAQTLTLSVQRCATHGQVCPLWRTRAGTGSLHRQRPDLLQP